MSEENNRGDFLTHTVNPLQIPSSCPMNCVLCSMLALKMIASHVPSATSGVSCHSDVNILSQCFQLLVIGCYSFCYSLAFSVSTYLNYRRSNYTAVFMQFIMQIYVPILTIIVTVVIFIGLCISKLILLMLALLCLSSYLISVSLVFFLV